MLSECDDRMAHCGPFSGTEYTKDIGELLPQIYFVNNGKDRAALAQQFVWAEPRAFTDMWRMKRGSRIRVRMMLSLLSGFFFLPIAHYYFFFFIYFGQSWVYFV